MTHKRIFIALIFILLILTVVGVAVYRSYFASTRILIVNPLPAQKAEMMLNNDDNSIDVTCVSMEDAHNFADYDAVLMYGRGLFLDSLQLSEIDDAAAEGVKIYTNALRNFSFIVNRNLDSAQMDTLRMYFRNPCRANYVNLLRYVRSVATPGRIGCNRYDAPVIIPSEMYYHLEEGKYFESAEHLTDYLKKMGLYHEGCKTVAFISGITFPVEGNRAHIDTLISRIMSAGYNVYPMSAAGNERHRMIQEVNPDAIVYLPMGRLGNDSLIQWCYGRGIPLFMPFPLIQPREEWLDADNPVSAGTLNARIVVPEIDGAMTPLCISTQDADDAGYLLYRPEAERVDAFIEQFDRFMRLREMRNADKRIAIGYFKSPGKDALLASGMEVVPSLYNFLKRLRAEGYNVSGLPATVDDFKRQLMKQGSVMGSYAPAAQRKFMEEDDPIWIDKDTYQQWASELLLPEKYREVIDRYGKAPGNLLARGDSMAVAAVRYGNILLFPQPRPALGDDDFRLVHGEDVAPPHSYIAAYLYMLKGFDADALIHFGTHGNLEFTPGKNVGLSQADWAEVLVGNRPHFYFYTTGNVGEAIIAKRRSHAVIVSHLTPPYVESGLRQKYASLLECLHGAIADSAKNDIGLKKSIVSLGLHTDLRLDSISDNPYTIDELRTVDSFVEEIANEKITGAYYVMGHPYGDADMTTTLVAIMADKIAYGRACKDFDAHKITEKQLHDFEFIRHNYLPGARRTVISVSKSGRDGSVEAEEILKYKDLLSRSPRCEFDAMIGALSGHPVSPTPGGDPVLNPNVLPTGRNMFSINAEATPGIKAWSDGVSLAEQTLASYFSQHGEYPRKVSYTFWAGEFISSQGATLAQALRMLGVEPVRDGQGRVIDLRLTPSQLLGRPRINVMVQVSGQLRDIAGSRLQLLTEAVKIASQATDDVFPNYVADGTVEQERELVSNGVAPQEARELSTMRVFGPVNSGYSSGMLRYTENSGEWDDRSEIAGGFVNNMCAMYGDTAHWGAACPQAMRAAVIGTDVIVQPRQSNTWGPISLDHVYEFTGGLSLLAASINGTEPDAVMADYRNAYMPRLQDAKQAVAVEVRATLLNPAFISERMKGDATTAQMFGEMFRNIFGWSVMRQSALNENIYNDLYDTYVADCHGLGIEEYFSRVNPAALQEMTATMLESARKGYWNPTDRQLECTARLHAAITAEHGAPCTEFVCGNRKLQQFITRSLDATDAKVYVGRIDEAISSGADGVVMKEDTLTRVFSTDNPSRNRNIAIAVGVLLLLVCMLIGIRRLKFFIKKKQ